MNAMRIWSNGSKENPRMNELTNNNKNPYNKGDPERCSCGRVIAFQKEGKLYVKCKECNRWVAILSINKIKKAQ